MKLLLENWRKHLAENRKTGTLSSDYPGYVEVYGPYSEDQKVAHVGEWDEEEGAWVDQSGMPLQAEILGSWSDKGMRWLEVDISGTKGWIGDGELTMDEAVDGGLWLLGGLIR